MTLIANSQIEMTTPSLGGKGARLVELRTLGFPVPDFIVLPVGFSDWENLDMHIEEQFQDYNGLFAVRSSAVGEDNEKNSFAGQFLTRLNVAKINISTAVREVQSSIHAPQVKAYCEQFKLPQPQDIAVVIQKMINPDVSGVAFGVHPISFKKDTKLIEAVWGLGEGLVSGELDSDSFSLSNAGQVETTISEKQHYFRTCKNSKKRLYKGSLNCSQ